MKQGWDSKEFSRSSVSSIMISKKLIGKSKWHLQSRDNNIPDHLRENLREMTS